MEVKTAEPSAEPAAEPASSTGGSAFSFLAATPSASAEPEEEEEVEEPSSTSAFDFMGTSDSPSLHESEELVGEVLAEEEATHEEAPNGTLDAQEGAEGEHDAEELAIEADTHEAIAAEEPATEDAEEHGAAPSSFSFLGSTTSAASLDAAQEESEDDLLDGVVVHETPASGSAFDFVAPNSTSSIDDLVDSPAAVTATAIPSATSAAVSAPVSAAASAAPVVAPASRKKKLSTFFGFRSASSSAVEAKPSSAESQPKAAPPARAAASSSSITAAPVAPPSAANPVRSASVAVVAEDAAPVATPKNAPPAAARSTTPPPAAANSYAVLSPAAPVARESLEDAVLYAEARVTTLRDRFARLDGEQHSLLNMLVEVSKELLSTQLQLNATEQDQIAAGDREDYNQAEQLNDVIDGLKRHLDQLNKRIKSINESLKQHHDRKVHMVEAEVSVRSELFGRLTSLQGKEDEAFRDYCKSASSSHVKRKNMLEIERDRIQRKRTQVTHEAKLVDSSEQELQEHVHADGREFYEQRDTLVKERSLVQGEIDELEAKLATLRLHESSLSEKIGSLEDSIQDISAKYASKLEVLQQERADVQERNRELDRAELTVQESERNLDKERVELAKTVDLRKDKLSQMRARIVSVVDTTSRLSKSAQFTKDYLLSRKKTQDQQGEKESELVRCAICLVFVLLLTFYLQPASPARRIGRAAASGPCVAVGCRECAFQAHV